MTAINKTGPDMILTLFALTFLILCVCAALSDIATLTIPNTLNAWLAFLFIPACFIAAPGWDIISAHLIAGSIAFIVSLVLFVFGVWGGGDAKMAPAVMLWIGPAGAIDFIYAMSIAGFFVALGVIAGRHFVPALNAPDFAFRSLQKEEGIPYGVAIMAGVFWAAPKSVFFVNMMV